MWARFKQGTQFCGSGISILAQVNLFSVLIDFPAYPFSSYPVFLFQRRITIHIVIAQLDNMFLEGRKRILQVLFPKALVPALSYEGRTH